MYLSWLLIISLLAPSISAFYPYPDAKTVKGKATARRFYPWNNGDSIGTDNPEIPTISIKKSGQNVRIFPPTPLS
jgi:hypothetical protein